eukprot:93197-Amphidinium_carterae.1
MKINDVEPDIQFQWSFAEFRTLKEPLLNASSLAVTVQQLQQITIDKGCTSDSVYDLGVCRMISCCACTCHLVP